MKRILAISVAVLISFGMFAQNQPVKTYLIKSGHVKYKMGGNAQGTHEIWWDNYGDWKREEKNVTTTAKMLGIKSETKEHTVIISKGKLVWTADLEKNTGTKAINPMYDMVQAQMGDMSEEEQEEMSLGILSGLGGKKEVGKDEVMGYECDVIKAMGVKTWTYKNVPLKTESKILGISSSEIATDFDPNASVSASKFEPLSNIDYKLPDPSMEKEFEAALNNPDGVGAAKKIIPLSYPFEKFKAKMNAFNPEGYQRMGPMKLMGIYTCGWQKSENDMMTVAASSTENAKEDEDGNKFDFEEMSKAPGADVFTRYGQTCYYINTTPEEGQEPVQMLMIHYKSQKMMVMVMKKPDGSKASLLEFYDKVAL